MEPQSPTPPEQPSATPQPDMAAPAPMPATQEPMTASPTPQPAMGAPMAAPVASGQNPGHGMGIAGLVLAFLAPLIGLILSIIAMNKSKKAGMKNGLALAGIIVGSINVVVGLIVGSLLVMGAAKIASVCSEEGPGTHFVDGATYTCD
jgi:hypothetical protein